MPELQLVAGKTTTQSIVSSQGTIVNAQQSHSYTIYQQSPLYYVKNENGDILASSTDFSVVWNYTLNSGGSTLIKNGIYYLHSVLGTGITSNVTVIGESEDGCIIDLSQVWSGSLSFGSLGYNPSGQYAFIIIRGTNLTIKNLTFQNCNGVVLGLGEYDTNTPAQNCNVQNLKFKNCSGGGIYFYDGSGSIVSNIKSDVPYGSVYFWAGDQKNIEISNIYNEPTLVTSPTGVDSQVAFLPYSGKTGSNITVDNVVANYTTYFNQGGTNFHSAGAVSFDATNGGVDGIEITRGNVTWSNLYVNNVQGIYSPALSIFNNFTGLSNSVFQNIYSSNALGMVPNGIFIPVWLSNADITISDIVFDEIHIDNAYGAGFNFLLSSLVETSSTSVRTVVQGVTLKNLYLTDNNQQRGTINSSGSVLYWGIGGLNIGNHGSGINIFDDLTIENLQATDSQAVPTQQYPVVLWNYGASGTAFTNVKISSYIFSGNTYNVIYQLNNQGNVNILGY